MLDIAPPPSTNKIAPGPITVEPVDMMISDEDPSGAWSLEGSGSGGRRVARRRTTTERPGGEFVSRERAVLRKRRRLAEIADRGRHGRSSEG